MPRQNLHLLMIIAIVSALCYERAGPARTNRLTETFSTALRLIDQRYVEPVNERLLFDGAMRGMMQQLDGVSEYIGPREATQFLQELDKEFGGIGIEVNLDPETKRLTVVSPLAGTPAYMAGVLAGDTILKINGEDTEGLTLQDAVARLRGDVGDVVSLTVQHRGAKEPATFDIARAVIHVDTVLGDRRFSDGSWDFFLPGRDAIAYVRIIAFSKDTVEELKATLERLHARGMRALIVDLRNNPGGLLQAGTQTCDLFIDRGRIVSIRDRERREQEVYDATGDGAYTDVPLVVLVNRFSASASEIVAACLQDHRRAIIVGERSYGKGTVQSVINLEGGESVLKLTTASYWRPSGNNIHRTTDAKEGDIWGVAPNAGFEVKMTDAEFEVLLRDRRARDIIQSGSSREALSSDGNGTRGSLDLDPQLRKAVEYLRESLRNPAGAIRAAG